MLELDTIRCHAPGFVLGPVKLQLALGGFHILLGPSGSGKSMLLETLAGLRPLAGGEIRIAGKRIDQLPPERRNFGYLPQDNVLFPHLSVEQNIGFALRLRQQKNPSLLLRIAQQLQIEHLLKRPTQGLSGGEQQRIALARSLVAGNQVLLLDEPSSALHQTLRQELCYLLAEVHRVFGITVLMVTHDAESAFMLGNTISFLLNGRIEQHFTNAGQVFLPTNEAVARFTGIRNLFEVVVRAPNQVYCPALNCQFKVPAHGLAPNAHSWLGIKSDDVRIVCPELPMAYTSANRLKVRIVQLFRKATAITLITELLDSLCRIEVSFPLTKYEKLVLEPGSKLEIVFQTHRIFLVDKPSFGAAPLGAPVLPSTNNAHAK